MVNAVSRLVHDETSDELLPLSQSSISVFPAKAWSITKPEADAFAVHSLGCSTMEYVKKIQWWFPATKFLLLGLISYECYGVLLSLRNQAFCSYTHLCTQALCSLLWPGCLCSLEIPMSKLHP